MKIRLPHLNLQKKNLLAMMLIFPAVVVLLLLVNHINASALPEYAKRTGEPCAVCHVNPGGGGPRTLRGLLWAARGKPDKVPELPGVMIAPGVSDGVELYQIACSGCHGTKGEGSSAGALKGTQISQATINDFALNGIPKLGMPAFKGLLTDDQMNTLVTYVTGLSSGEIPPPPDSYPLAPPLLSCAQAPADPVCNYSVSESGGN